MNNVLIAIGLLIVGLFSVLFAIPYVVDWNAYRGVIEEEATRIAGRDVRIGGEIKMQLLPSPSFVIEKLRVADVATGSGEPLFKAERVYARLSVVPLFRGVLEANEIELVTPVLRYVVDDNGQGNLRSFAQGRGTLPFMPTDVALQALKITDGALTILDRNGKRERLTLTSLHGELSAPQLGGPYRFKGGYGTGTEAREIRLTTVPAAADGVVPFKASLKDLTTSASAVLDGRLSDPFGHPRVGGQVTAQLPMPQVATAAIGAKPAERNATSPVVSPVANLKAEFDGDAQMLALKSLSIAFDGESRPQVLAGGATVTWGEVVAVQATLSAPWIDLDHVFSNPDGGNPLQAMAEFGQRINGILSGAADTKAVVEIEQASFGHDIVSGIRMDARSTSGLLAVEQLQATLPGNTRVDIHGRVAGQGIATTFEGELIAQGTSVTRAAAWASAGSMVIAAAQDRPFQMRAHLSAEPGRGSLRDVVALIGDSTLGGEAEYSWAAPRKLRLALEGPRIDGRSVMPAGFSLRSLADAFSSVRAKDDGKSGSGLAVSLSLKAAELILPDHALRDVIVVLSGDANEARVDRLQFAADHGVAVALENVASPLPLPITPAATTPDANPATIKPSGDPGSRSQQLRGSVAADDIDGLQKLATFISFPLATLASPEQLGELVPLRMAVTYGANPGSIAVSRERAAGVADHRLNLVMDGRLGQSDAKIRLDLAGGLDGWRTSPMDLDAVLLGDAALGARALKFLSGSVDARDKQNQSTKASNADAKARLAVRISGIPERGAPAVARFDSADATVFLNGGVVANEAGGIDFSGDVKLDARDGRRLLASALGGELALRDPLTFGGTASIHRRAGVLELTDIAFRTSGGAEAAGALTLSPGTPRRLDGDLSLSSLALDSLLMPVLRSTTWEVTAAQQIAAGASGAVRASVWPQRAFAFGQLGDLEAGLRLRTDELRISDQVAVAQAKLSLAVHRDSFEVTSFEGIVLGGTVSGRARLAETPGGADLRGNIEITGARLERFGGTGAADASLSINGRNSTLAAVMSTLTGSGALKLSDATFRDVTPATLQSATETALKGPPEKLGPVVRELLAAAASRAAVNFGARALPVDVQDGFARIPALAMSSPEGKITAQAALDMASFAMSGFWRVETQLAPTAMPSGQAASPSAEPANQPLPPVERRFALTPADLASNRPSRRAPFDIDAFEHELAIRKVERDLAELERLRRLDEARAALRELEAKSAAGWASQTDVRPEVKPDTPPQPATAQ